MGRKIALFCALIGVLAFVASPAYAEVQNIKISGDIEAKAVYRDNYDLEGGLLIQGSQQPDERRSDDKDSFLMSIVRLRLDADLTDNVSAAIRLANLRDWDADRNMDSGVAAAGLLGVQNANNVDDASIILDLAYVTLKEMLYSPLTLVIGRQELLYGSGLIIGPGLYQNPNNSIEYADLGALHGYDAVRAILDYDPWTFDLLMAKMVEGDDTMNAQWTAGAMGADRDSDTDLYGLNVGYTFGSYDAEMEGYLFAMRDPNWNYRVDTVNEFGAVTYSRLYEESNIYTLGLRGSAVPLENLNVGGEIGGQFGSIRDEQLQVAADVGFDGGQNKRRGRKAMLLYGALDYTFADIRMTPVFGFEYLFLSGGEADEDTGHYEDWDPMYRSKVMGSIRDYMETLYRTNDNLDTSGLSNQNTIKATSSLDLGELVDGLSLDLAYLHYWFAEEPVPGGGRDVGDEVNMLLSYDYTEDVQFTLNGAWFAPGSYYDRAGIGNGERGLRANATVWALGAGNQGTGRPSNDTAVSIVGSCKVTF